MNNEVRLTVKELPTSERPYEKLEKYGATILSDAELLAIIIKSGTQKERSIDLAHRVLTLNKRGLAGIHQTSLNELESISGIGRVKAIQIKAIAELSTRIAKTNALQKVQISSPGSVANIYMEEMRHLQQEHLKIVLLDTKNNIMSDHTLSVGTVNASLINPREVFIHALKNLAVHMIILHNHPSGDPTPSKEDISITKRIIEASDIIGIKLLDHIIIGDGNYISLKERGIC
ncbi:MAG: DNA repair protein RadC [Vallitaleaceae bacterium]|nr:DNA repair protein RadC [Vallitaleaceae bacterium]